MNSSGELVVEYRYNPYGKVTYTKDSSGCGLENVNPFRFKSYFFDIETEFYYCSSRYYNPEIARWINADLISYLNPSSINENNLYTYCGNNPIMYSDPTGHFLILGSILLTKIVIATVATITAYYVAEVTVPMVSDAIDYVIDEIKYSGNTLDKVSNSTKEGAAAIETSHTEEHQDDYDVYLLLDQFNDVFYVGITSNVNNRIKYHKLTKPKYNTHEVVAENISLAQARVLETKLIIEYGTLNKNDINANHIFSVNKARIDFEILMGKAESDALLILGR